MQTSHRVGLFSEEGTARSYMVQGLECKEDCEVFGCQVVINKVHYMGITFELLSKKSKMWHLNPLYWLSANQFGYWNINGAWWTPASKPNYCNKNWTNLIPDNSEKCFTSWIGSGPSETVALRGTHLSRRNSMISCIMNRIRCGNSGSETNTDMRSKYCCIKP